MKTREQFHRYLVELLTTGDASIPRSVALEVADQVIETVDSNPALFSGWDKGARMAGME